MPSNDVGGNLNLMKEKYSFIYNLATIREMPYFQKSNDDVKVSSV